MHSVRIAYTLVALLGAAACGGGADGGTNNPPPPPPTVGSVAVTLANPTIEAGAGTSATAVVKDGAGNTLSGRAVSWSSSNPAIATIAGTGAVTGIAPGTVAISATSEGKVGTSQLTVSAPAVASVTVTLANASIPVGAGTQATLLLRDGRGNTLTGRPATWQSTNPTVASVSGTGAVIAVGAGTTMITATSESVSGSAQLVVTPPPVTQVAIFGTTRVKVGDTYQYTAEARLADNTLVQRPVTWTVVEPGKGTITQAGVLTPLATGAITVRATVENVSFNGAVTGYDWQFVSGATIMGATLPADLLVTNKFGQSEYPELTIVCSAAGNFSLWVDTERFVTANGIVAFSFDGGAAIAQNWIEFDNFSALGHPGSTNASRKNMAIAIAGSRLFGFAFGEFLSVTRVAQFRVTGLGPHLATMLNACPSNAIMSGIAAENTESFWERVPSELLRATPMDAVRQLRLERGPAGDADRTIPSVPAAIDPTRLQSRP
ncbi:MAG: Ig-like domain-containing protein [Gemmatimonadales bacterium]|nr:Ig-like domain-containing protein [Gemmatimonadales bacterium]